VRSRARIVAEAAQGGGTRLTELSAPAPLGLRETDDGLFLVSSAQGLLAEDDLELDIVVGRGAHLRLRSAAAAVAYSSTDARLQIRARVASAASLDWSPEPLIATSKCRLRVSARIDLDQGAAVQWNDQCILGRSGEEPGELELSLSLNYMDRPALRHRIVLSDASGWEGPAVLGDARALGTLLQFDPRAEENGPRPRPASGPSWAVLPLEAGGLIVNALGADLFEMQEAMACACRHLAALRAGEALGS
jgi:urease accessory protein